MQNRFGLLDTDVMPMFMIIALDIVITLRFSINCWIVICLPTVCFLSREKPLVKTMAPGSIFYHIIFRSIKPKTQKYLAAIYLSLLYFALLFIFYINLYQISSLQVTWRDWQPLYHVGCKCLIVCVGASIGDLRVSPTGLIPWFLTEGNTYLYFACSDQTSNGLCCCAPVSSLDR